MIKRIELVIFDCDGVLVASERIAARVQVALGAERGWPLTEDEVMDRFIGRSHASIREQVGAQLCEGTAAPAWTYSCTSPNRWTSIPRRAWWS